MGWVPAKIYRIKLASDERVNLEGIRGHGSLKASKFKKVTAHSRQFKARMPDSMGDCVELFPLEICRGSGLKLMSSEKSFSLIR